jgi:hypothetical protein
VHLAIRSSLIASNYSAIYYRQIAIAYLAIKTQNFQQLFSNKRTPNG